MERYPFYITTTLPYVNAEPHIGFAMELIRADVIARYRVAQGFDVFFNTGTDEHGLKLYQKAFELGEPTQDYVDRYVKTFQSLKGVLGLEESIHFVRTTDPHHKTAAQAFWNLCNEKGFIYKKNYKAKYCVGCELERSDSELIDGKCFLHPNLDITFIEEENYFFKFSAFQQKLLDFYKENPGFVTPNFRFNEVRAFVERGLEDFSISRLKSKMPWGVDVPGDADHVMYVWFDALVNYISTLGWPEDKASFEKYWKEGTPVQYCGKDNLRQQAAMWQAMLMAAGLPNTQQIVINGFVTGENGIKMSKSLGNTVNPFDIVKEYGTDALRYYVLRELHPFEDSPFTMEKFKEAYNAKLANGLGNLVSRVMKMAVTVGAKIPLLEKKEELAWAFFSEDFVVASSGHNEYYDAFEINKAMDDVWKRIALVDKMIQDEQPFKLIKSDPIEAKKKIELLVKNVYCIALLLRVAMPETSKKIRECVYENKMPETPLFARKD